MRYCDAGGCMQAAIEIGKFVDHGGMTRTVAACGEEHKTVLELGLKLAQIQPEWRLFERRKDEGV